MTTEKTKACLRCGRQQRKNYAAIGAPLVPKLSRGLCGACYTKTRKEGRLDEVALPPVGPTYESKPDGSKTYLAEGYVNIKADGVWQSEHRYVMSQAIGRELSPGENVHHINGDRSDNRIENLELWYSPQPYGQRVADLIAYALKFHREALVEAMASVPNIAETGMDSCRPSPESEDA